MNQKKLLEATAKHAKAVHELRMALKYPDRDWPLIQAVMDAGNEITQAVLDNKLEEITNGASRDP